LYAVSQNIGLSLVPAAALILVVPHMRGLRWLWFLTFFPSVMWAYCIAATFPAYLAVHSDFPAGVNWAIGIICFYLSFAMADAAVRIDQVARLRQQPDTYRSFQTELVETFNDAYGGISGRRTLGATTISPRYHERD
jgi:hypothetical protein